MSETENERKPGYMERFYDSLREHGIQHESECVYVGGNRGSHHNYFKLKSRTQRMRRPSEVGMCLCGHYIEEQCYIRHKQSGRMLVVGNHCVKRFKKRVVRTCEALVDGKRCGGAHRNFSVDLCNTHKRGGYCHICLRKLGEDETMCIQCKLISKSSRKRNREEYENDGFCVECVDDPWELSGVEEKEEEEEKQLPPPVRPDFCDSEEDD